MEINLILYIMKTFTFKVDEYDKEVLKELQEALHPTDTLRLRFDGVLSLMPNLCQVSISIVEGLRTDGRRRLTGYKGKEYMLLSTLDKLPNFKKKVNGDGHLIVYFEAAVLSIQGNRVQIELPDSYTMEREKEAAEEEYKVKTFTFKTEHTYLLKLISMILTERPVAYFYGPLSTTDPSQNKVEVSLPVKLEAVTEGGGRVSLSTQDMPLAVLDDLPEWGKRAEKIGCPGFMFVNFEAVIVKACNGEITVKLPEHYR